MSEYQVLLKSNSSPETEFKEINEIPDKNTAIFQGDKRKFTVVNYQDRYGPPTASSFEEDSVFIKPDEFNVNHTKEKLHASYSITELEEFDSEKGQSLSYEDEDGLSDEFGAPNMNLKNLHAKYREAEGQDTITSMSNQVFIKKLDKIKMIRKSSIKNANQDSANIDETPVKELTDSNTDLNALNSSVTSVTSNRPRTLTDLFTRKRNSNSSAATPTAHRPSQHSSHASLFNEIKRTNLLDFIKSDTQSLATVPVNSGNDLVNDIEEQLVSKQTIDPLAGSEGLVQTSKSDQVFLVLKDAIDNNDSLFLDKIFIDTVFSTLKYQQLKEKRHKDNVRRICRFFELLVFFLITIMTLFLIYHVFHQLMKIHEVSSRTSYKIDINE